MINDNFSSLSEETRCNSPRWNIKIKIFSGPYFIYPHPKPRLHRYFLKRAHEFRIPSVSSKDRKPNFNYFQETVSPPRSICSPKAVRSRTIELSPRDTISLLAARNTASRRRINRPTKTPLLLFVSLVPFDRPCPRFFRGRVKSVAKGLRIERSLTAVQCVTISVTVTDHALIVINGLGHCATGTWIPSLSLHRMYVVDPSLSPCFQSVFGWLRRRVSREVFIATTR